MTFFTNAQGLEINGGQFTSTTTVVITNNSNGSTGIDILREASTPEAAYDSSMRASPPRCFPGTRQQYIEDIMHWAVPAVGDIPFSLYWMNGPAGVGKTAIAQTCAEKLKSLGKLGAAFFFSINGRDKPETFFPSIAYQLATIYPAYRDLIDRKIRQDQTLVDKTMESQFHALIVEPLLELEALGEGIGKRIPILVDGLDECEGVDAQCEIIRVIALAAHHSVIPLCWGFFSRQEPHIQATFTATDIAAQTRMANLPISKDADGEIEYYLRGSFENMLRRRNISMQSPWPSEGDMRTLVGAASGSFIYAATALRFIAHLDGLGPEKRLRLVIDVILERVKRGHGIGASAKMPFAELDAFYVLIMKRISPGIFPSTHLLLSQLCGPVRCGALMLANFTRLSKVEFELICHQMNSVVEFQDSGHNLDFDPTIDTTRPYTQIDQSVLPRLSRMIQRDLGGSVSFYHKSFSDFLLDPERSGRYCVRNVPGFGNHEIKLHLDYDKSYRWQGLDLVPAPDFPDSASSLSYPYANELVNSLIKAWVYRFVANRFTRKLYDHVEGKEEIECDHRKNLYVVATVWRALNPNPDVPFTTWLSDCRCHSRSLPGTRITWLRGSEFHKFDIARFKQIVEQRRLTKFIRPYYTDLSSRLKSLLPSKSPGNVESGLYRVGRGEKSIYWYWEINHELEYYREFQTIDLAKGQKIFRQERFDLWPQH